MKTILESQTARMLMKEGGGFAVNAYVDDVGHALFSPPTASLAANLKGENMQSYRAGWFAHYVVRVWPKRPAGGTVKDVHTYKPGDAPGTYTLPPHVDLAQRIAMADYARAKRMTGK